MAYCAARFAGSGLSHASMCSGLIGMMQRSWPANAISCGGSSVTAANDSRSGSPFPSQCYYRHAISISWGRLGLNSKTSSSLPLKRDAIFEAKSTNVFCRMRSLASSRAYNRKAPSRTYRKLRVATATPIERHPKVKSVANPTIQSGSSTSRSAPQSEVASPTRAGRRCNTNLSARLAMTPVHMHRLNVLHRAGASQPY